MNTRKRYEANQLWASLNFSDVSFEIMEELPNNIEDFIKELIKS